MHPQQKVILVNQVFRIRFRIRTLTFGKDQSRIPILKKAESESGFDHAQIQNVYKIFSSICIDQSCIILSIILTLILKEKGENFIRLDLDPGCLWRVKSWSGVSEGGIRIQFFWWLDPDPVFLGGSDTDTDQLHLDLQLVLLYGSKVLAVHLALDNYL